MRRIRIVKTRVNRYPGIALIVILSLLLTYALGWSKLFVVSKIEISTIGIAISAGQQSQAQAIATAIPADLYIGMPLARIGSRQIANRLETLDWIAKVQVQRDWFARAIKLVISPRIPVLRYLDQAGTNYLADSSGESFQSASNGDTPLDMNLPLLTWPINQLPARDAVAASLRYLNNFNQMAEHRIWPFKFATANQLARLQLNLTGLDNLSTIEKDAHGQVVRNIIWGSSNNLTVKANVLSELATLAENKKVTFYDLSDPAAPIVK